MAEEIVVLNCLEDDAGPLGHFLGYTTTLGAFCIDI